MTFNKSNVIVSGSRSSLNEYANYTTVFPKPVMVGDKIVLTQDMINKQNVKYIIKWNFDLNDETLTVPEECLIEFDGGSFSNGTLVGNETILVYNQEEEDVFKNVSLEGSFERSTSAIADKMDNTNGMAKIYLKKNKPLATQLTQPNTIYVIQYDFDLNDPNGENPITIPTNCVLQFEGGSIKNGTINSDDVVIVSEKKCLENIKFTGNRVKSKMYLKWWINKYPVNTLDYTVDNTSEIRDALASGAKRLVFPTDKYLYISQTIVIEDDLDIYADGEHQKYNSGPRLTDNAPWLNGTREVPCIFTKDVITMFDYRLKSSIYKYQIHIGAITLVNLRPFSDLSEKDVPILKISSGYGTPIWGLDVHCNICAADNQITVNGIENYYVSYTGVEVHAGSNPNNAYVSYVRLYGYILQCYNAYRFTSDGSWFTDAYIYGDTWCVIGLNTNYGVPTIIHGAHQPRANFTENDKKGTAYFKSPWINLYGYVWDSNNKTEISPGNYLWTAETSVIVTGDTGHYNTSDSLYIDHFDKIHVEHYVYDYRKPKIKHYNSLRLSMFNGTHIIGAFPTLDYTINGTSIFNYAKGNNTIKLYNHDNVFPKEFTANGNGSWIASVLNANARIQDLSAGNMELKCSFIMNTSYKTGRVLVFSMMEPTSNVTRKLTIETDTVATVDSANKETLASNIDIPMVYYRDALATIMLDRYGTFKQYVKVTITISKSNFTGGTLSLPIIGLIGSEVGVLDEDGPFRDNIGLPLIEAGQRYGAKAIASDGIPMVWTGSYWQRYDGKTFNNWHYLTYATPQPGGTSKGGYFVAEELQRPVYWNGTKWLDSDGYSACYNHGTTAKRIQGGQLTPKSVLTSDDKGFRYFDEDLGKPVYWTGTAWVDATGATV